MTIERLHRLAQRAVVFLLAFSVLWKGGKSLETTWLLVGIAWVFILCSWWYDKKYHVLVHRIFDGHDTSKRDSDVQDTSWLLWCVALGFALWTVLSYVTSRAQNYGLDELLRDGTLSILLLIIVREVRRDAVWRDQLLSVLAVTACVAAIIGVPVYILQPVSRFVGTFFDHRFHTDYWPNAWAQFVLMSWPIMLWWALRPCSGSFDWLRHEEEWPEHRRCVDHERAKRVEWWGWRSVVPVQQYMRFVLLGVLLGTLLLSYSRGALLVFGGQVGMGMLLLYVAHLASARVRAGPINNNIAAVVIPGCVIVLVAIVTFTAMNAVRTPFFPVESALRKATFTADEGISSINERSQFWRQALTLSREHPLLGHGPYSFRFLQPGLQDSVYTTSDHPHNVFLKLAMERGWPAAVLFGLLCGLVLLRTLAVLLRNHAPQPFLSAALFIAACGVLFHNLIDYNLQFVGIALPFILLLGITESLHVGLKLPNAGRRFRRGVEIALVTIFLVVALSEGRYLILSSLGRHAEARGEAAAALGWYRASSDAVFSRDLHLSRANLFQQQGLIDDAVRSLSDYFRQNGEDARAWKMWGDLARQRGDFPSALAAYGEAYARGRYNYLSILEGMVLTWEELHDDETPEAMEEEIMTILRRYADAIHSNTHFIALSDNVETFLRTAAMLKGFYPAHEAQLDVLAAKVDRHAKEERARFQARRPGMLW